MGAGGITRDSQIFEPTAASPIVDSSAASCREIPMAGFVGGSIVIPAGSSLTSITIHGAHKLGGTFYPLHDNAGGAVSITVTHTKIYDLPTAVYSCAAIKLVGSHDDANASVFMKG